MLTAHSPLIPNPAETQLLQETKVVLQSLRSSLLSVLTAVGADATRPQEMARQFGLNKNLTWKISRVLREPDSLAAISHLPGRPGLKIFLDAMERSGASTAAIDRVRNSIHELDSLVRVHSGDRETLEAIVGGMTGAGAQARGEAQRKLAFRGNSATWGVQCRVQVSCHLVAPNPANPDTLDVAIVSGLVDFRRLRPDVPWAVATMTRTADDFTNADTSGFIAIDPGQEQPDNSTLMPEFCSRPTPRVRMRPGSGPHTQRIELVEGAVGNTGAATCIAGWCHRGQVSRYRSPEDTYGALMTVLSTPAELVIHDVFAHRDLPEAHRLRASLYNQLPSGPLPRAPIDDSASLPLHEQAQSLGYGPPDVVTPELAWYPAMIDRVMQRLGWNLAEFHATRIRIAYPPIPTRLALVFDLAEKPR